jgi:hypothetical protein
MRVCNYNLIKGGTSLQRSRIKFLAGLTVVISILIGFIFCSRYKPGDDFGTVVIELIIVCTIAAIAEMIFVKIDKEER